MNLISAITQADKQQISVILRSYKFDNGAVNYPAVLSIPQESRIPELAKKDFQGTIAAIGAALTIAVESMNLVRGLNASQIWDLAEAIIDTSNEDRLSLEDFMLFLQKMTRGEYGKLYESMDIPKFMELFEKYREERWQELNKIKLDRHSQHKGSGISEKSSTRDPLDEHFYGMAGRLSELNEQLKSSRKENRKLKDIDKF
jgi:hypothetical protein